MAEQKKQKVQYTKILISRITIWAMFVVGLTYFLAFFGRPFPETLSIRIVELTLGVVIVYCLKSYFETKEAEKTRLKEKELDIHG